MPSPKLCGTGHGLCENTDRSECSQALRGTQWQGTTKAFRSCAQSSSGDVNDSTQHSQGEVELDWVLREKVIRFVAHSVSGNSAMLLSRSDLKALEATIDQRNDQMHLENPRTTLKLSIDSSGSPRGRPSELDQGGGRGSLAQ